MSVLRFPSPDDARVSNVYDLRPWQSAVRYGPNVYRAVRRAIKREQEAGGNGFHALHNTFDEKRRGPK